MRILIVDDDDGFRLMLRDALSSVIPREQIAVATDGDEAWWILTDPERRFDLIVLDLTMPRVSGLDLLRRIRQHSGLTDLGVILCTGKSTRETVTEAARQNVISYVVKPFAPSYLVNKVEEAMVQLRGAASQ